jgi:glycosyltransferase involved in cell wall biosynthesis
MSNEPIFSVIIPTYNRPDLLQKCLQSLTILDYPRDRFAAIVVDDGSARPLDRIIAPYQADLAIALLRQPNAGAAAARNTGAAKAEGKYLAFIDDDCTPAADWLQRLAEHFKVNPDCLIGGRTINALPENVYATASQLIVDMVYEHYNAIPTQAKFFASNNLALSANQFQAMGGFNSLFRTSEDREFCDRWLNSGRQMLYAPDVQIYHAHNLTLQGFFWQHFSYGCGAFRFHRLRFQKGLGYVKVEPNFYLKLLIYPMTKSSTQPPLLLTVLFILSQIASMCGLVWQLRRVKTIDMVT